MREACGPRSHEIQGELAMPFTRFIRIVKTLSYHPPGVKHR